MAEKEQTTPEINLVGCNFIGWEKSCPKKPRKKDIFSTDETFKEAGKTFYKNKLYVWDGEWRQYQPFIQLKNYITIHDAVWGPEHLINAHYITSIENNQERCIIRTSDGEKYSCAESFEDIGRMIAECQQ